MDSFTVGSIILIGVAVFSVGLGMLGVWLKGDGQEPTQKPSQK
jgi:hypothetical protein